MAAAGALSAAALALPAAAGASAAPGPAAVLHPVKGCGTPVTLATPPRSGAALSGQALGLPDGPGSLLAAMATRSVRWLKTLKCTLRRTDPVRVRSGAVPNTSQNWSGYQDATTSPDFVQATWRVPAPCCRDGRHETSSVWPGLGSGSSKDTQLIQDGTESDISGSGVATYYAWFERYPAEAQVRVTNMPVRPGDKMTVSASYNASAAPGAVFVICNVTRHVCLAARQRSERPDGQAEWILERTSLCSGGQRVFPPLAPVGPFSFGSARFDLNGDGKAAFPVSHGKHVRVRMAEGGTLIATTGALSRHGTSFLIVQNSSGNLNHAGKC